MASRAISRTGGRAQPADWRAAFRRSLARAGQLAGAAILGAATLFVALALVSYTQTDPSLSTAAGGEVSNWMGLAGAYAAERALFLFGVVGVLFVPMLYAFARKLWRDAEHEETPHGRRWWRTFALLLLAMVLLGTAIALATAGWSSLPDSLPASWGGIAGLLGAGAVHALAGRLPEAAQFWTTLGLGLACLVAGAALVAKVFAFDWARLMTLPELLRRAPRLSEPNPFKPRKERRAQRPEALAEDGEQAPRRAPEITDPSRPPPPARLAGKSRQQDLCETYQLPSLDLLEDPPADTAPKVDKLSLERNARLLENVLDDFNVKGEITAVRTGPVVTMYELEPAPGIKASRVIGLAEDIV